MVTRKRLKILISAYACSPHHGSEPGVGWGFVSELAQHHELWVIVEEEKFRADIESYLAENPKFASTVHFYFLRKRRKRWLRRLWPPSYYWYYRKWHEQAFELAGQLHAEVGFDLAHQLTMVGFREPGYLWRLEIPFVWGPIGGMGVFPWRFLPVAGAYGALYFLGYNLLNLWQVRFSIRPRLAARAAGAGLITATAENQAGAARYWGCSSIVLSEIGLSPKNKTVKPVKRQRGEPLKIIWSGRHTPHKALNLGLSALAMIKEQPWELHVLGEGDSTLSWKMMADSLNLNSRCRFYGWVSREKSLDIMASAHVMLITSLRDLTSTVIIEGLAMGLPIVCLDHCGFSDVINDTCGIKVPVTSPSSTVEQLSNALQLLAVNDELRTQLAQGALIRSQDYVWKKKIEVFDLIYQDVLIESVNRKKF